ncbi:MAG TPA: hypothetical protein VF092_12370 [Longimicrobium sp.]
MHRIVSVLTRWLLPEEQGNAHADEFVAEWGWGRKDTHEPWVVYSDGTERSLVLIRGYRVDQATNTSRYPRDDPQRTTDHLIEDLTNCLDDRLAGSKLVVSCHLSSPPAGFPEVWRRSVAQLQLAGETLLRFHSREELAGPGSRLGALARQVRAFEASQEWTEELKAAFDAYVNGADEDEELENALQILHLCYTREGFEEAVARSRQIEHDLVRLKAAFEDGEERAIAELGVLRDKMLKPFIEMRTGWTVSGGE